MASLSPPTRAGRDRLVGSLVVVCLLLVAGALLWDRAVFTPTQRFVVDAHDVSGIDEGSVVRLQGYPVGEVQAVELLPGLPAAFAVHLRVRADVSLPQSVAASLTSGALGGPGEVLLNPTDPTDAAPLPPGTHIRGDPAPALADVLAQATETLELLRTNLASVDAALGPAAPGGGLAGVTGRVNEVLARATITADQAAGTLNALEKVAGQVGTEATATSKSATLAADRAQALLAPDGPFQRLLEESRADIDRIAQTAAGYDTERDPEMRRMMESLVSASCEMERFTTSFNRQPWKTLRGTAAPTVVCPADPGAAPPP